MSTGRAGRYVHGSGPLRAGLTAATPSVTQFTNVGRWSRHVHRLIFFLIAVYSPAPFDLDRGDPMSTTDPGDAARLSTWSFDTLAAHAGEEPVGGDGESSGWRPTST